MVSTLIAVAIFGLRDQIRKLGLEVGPGKQFARIEDAVASAESGDVIQVFPDPRGYPKTAVRIQVPSITIRGEGMKAVEIKGDGFDYSGSGSVPRAIFQIDPSGTGTTIENLKLSGAHNSSFNAAGVRIQGASEVTVKNCIIHDNDMGIMSNGKEGEPMAASHQRIEYCLIERNGNLEDPGYNHNLYLGGTSALVSHCEIRNSITGHNVKSRTHFIEIQGCYIHDAANREIDLPEAWDTVRPNSNAVLIGNRIVKNSKCAGNRGVIHFGQEKGSRHGNIFLFLNTIVTPFSSPILTVTCREASLIAEGNTFLNVDQGKVQLWESVANDLKVAARGNRLSPGYGSLSGNNTTALKRSEMFGLESPLFLNSPVPKLPISWIDGYGTTISITPNVDLFSKVGPQQL